MSSITCATITAELLQASGKQATQKVCQFQLDGLLAYSRVA